jgi:hypothetical protein
VAGDVKGVAEPPLALSVPAKPSDDDDGLLKASEVAQLKLNADWVVLSACNTIAGDKPGEGAFKSYERGRSCLISCSHSLPEGGRGAQQAGGAGFLGPREART